jgi:predicted MFS family arabinose efflux permease
VVVWATTLGAVLGPNLVGPADDVAVAAGFPEFAGPFVLGAVGLALGGAVIHLRLRPDPLLLSRSMALSRGERAQHDASLRRAWRVVRARPRAAAAIVAIAAAHTVMVSVMVMTPLHMDHGGAELEVIGFVISMHVLGMFAFAPVVGWLTDRLGRVTIMGTGGAILLTSVVLAGRTPDGASTTLTWALFLLGLGWSFALISCSALLVDAIPVAERPGVQGASDLVMGMAAAGGGALAGVVVGEWGYGTLNAGAGVVALAVPAAAFVVGFGSGARPLPDLQDASE